MVKQTDMISASKAERKSNFELLRILSMLMIVASHWGWWSRSYPGVLQDSVQKLFHSHFRTYGQVGVVLFILISGYFLCKNQFKTMSLLKLILQVLCTVCFLLIVYFVRGYIQTGTLPVLGITSFTDWFIPISTGRWWFVSCYVALFLLSPFLNKLMEHLKKNEFRILLAILFLFLSIFPSFFVLANANDALQNIGIFIFVYLIGAYIRLYEEDFQSKLLCFGGALLTLAIFVVGKEHGFGEYRYFIHVIALGVFLFLSFMHIPMQSKFINKCAKTTFGVYLLHENAVVTFWLWNDVFAIQNYANTAKFIPVSILSVIVTFSVCAMIEFLRQLCVEPLLMKGLRTPKISGWLAAIDDKMPTNRVKAEEGTKCDPAPALVLLSATGLYFACELLEFFTHKAVSYKLFLLSSVIIIAVVILIKHRAGAKRAK